MATNTAIAELGDMRFRRTHGPGVITFALEVVTPTGDAATYSRTTSSLREDDPQFELKAKGMERALAAGLVAALERSLTVIEMCATGLINPLTDEVR